MADDARASDGSDIYIDVDDEGNGHLQPRATPQSHVCTQLASVASEACGHRFENRMLGLSTLLSRWTNGEEISAVDEHVETATNVPPPVATADLHDLKKVEINGFNALMTNDNPHTIFVHSVCHRLNLAVAQARCPIS